ncbi:MULTISPECIES: thioredoxin family protein [unclassified Oceanispirochaeta]|uniref:thioredoxin family protein n=1 Tax=unclassified Oceanispirochaeta TaxID=2635722 RepID=UPI000E09CA0C|nr:MULTISPECIES: thioredoxin family protein [unclassified Oceanispirochaeta]MBF9014445.1 thioredoxin family protein [Oceanispirochaeta sp. M2]NPD74999.1 thioredoxin family protein [Oceanispirochaeta sp. M1]RDG29175.1 thioredoxin [Oceanispirochaeta sp. M1]
MLQELNDLETIQKAMSSEGFHFFYFSRPACGVCGAIKEKVLLMLKDYPGISSYYINLDNVPEAAGQFSLFTIPAVLLYIDGNEIIREARYISMDDLEAKVARPYGMAGL